MDQKLAIGSRTGIACLVVQTFVRLDLGASVRPVSERDPGKPSVILVLVAFLLPCCLAVIIGGKLGRWGKEQAAHATPPGVGLGSWLMGADRGREGQEKKEEGQDEYLEARLAKYDA